MAKQHSISLARKRELDQPDEFIAITNRILEIAREHRYKIASVIGIVLGVVAIFIGVMYYQNKTESAASLMLTHVLAKYDHKLKADGPVKAFLEVESDFQKLITEYGSTTSGKVARLRYANMCYRAEDFDKAISAYKQALTDFNDYPVIRNLILCDLGYVFDTKKNEKEAIACFQRIANGHSSLKKDDALYNLGRIYLETGEKEKGERAYERLIAEFPDSLYVEMVKERQAL